MRAAHTEVLEQNPEPHGETGAEGNQSSAEEHNSTDFNGSDYYKEIKEIEVNVYENEFYLQVLDNDIMAAITEVPISQDHHGKQDVK